MDTNMNIPRPEHPNPQWERSNWRNLNGEWEFEFDFSKSAREGKRFEEGSLSDKITVPFCPESKLSGIGYTDFIPSVCYRKIINITEPELSGRVFLHFGAVDYHAFLYVNGKPVGDHRGGYASFKFDITKYLHVGENTLFVIAEDDTKSRTQPTGKQSQKQDSYDYFYTRTTGIWQTVWLECTPHTYIGNAKYYPDIDNKLLFTSAVIHTAIAVIIIALAPFIPLRYNVEPEVRALATQCLTVAGLSLPIHAITHIIYFTVRSGGKTLITFLLDSGFTWAIPCVMSFILCKYTGIDVIWVYFAVQFSDLLKLFIGVPLFKSGFWARCVINDV